MPRQSIQFFSEDITFRPRNKELLRLWIVQTVLSESKKLHSLNFIFCSDAYLLDINRSFLNHDTFTDIITFDTALATPKISGDIYISIERVRSNALKFSIPEITELHRVIIHGVLHLCGYSDKGRKPKKLMTEKEDFYLALRPKTLIP